MRGSPTRPDPTARARPAWPGSQRNSVPSRWTTPAASAAARTSLASSVVGRERLLTQDVATGGDGLQGQRRVGVRRRGDGDGVDAGQGQRIVERRQRGGDVEEGGTLGRSWQGRARRRRARRTRRRAGHGRGCSSRSRSRRPPHRSPRHSRPCRRHPARSRGRRASPSAARVAASMGPRAWRSSENTSTPAGAAAPMSRRAPR